MSGTMTELPPGQQLTLPLGYESKFARVDLIETVSNRDALSLIDAWPNWSATVAAIIGPASSGKTHMATVWAGRAGAVFLDASHIEAMPQETRFAVIDDIDRAATLDQTGLFHLINAVKLAGGNVLITSSKPLAALDITLPDLASRLAAATRAEIAMPDDDLLRALIAKGFADRQLLVEPDVAAFLAPRIERSAKAAQDIVARLDQGALAKGARISRQFAASVLKEMQSQTEPELF
jgi:chromosomal replication initiation ATPase DnaA